MNEKQIKRHFEDKGFKISDVAAEMQKAFPSISLASADVMLRQLISGERWYPKYNDWLNEKYGVKVDAPEEIVIPIRQRMQRLAA